MSNWGCESHYIYVCHTVYHVYIAALKALQNEEPLSVVLIDTIPAVDELSERLNSEKIFIDVRILHIGDYFIKSRSYHVNRLYTFFMKATLKRKLSYLFRENSEIYLFNDYTEIGSLLNLTNRRYHLIEDGCDCYKNWDQYKPFGKAKSLKDFLWRHFRIPSGMGYGPNVIDLEVNNCEGIRLAFNWPVIEKPRRFLMNGLSKEDTDTLMRAFGAQDLGEIKPGSVLILTDPLWELGVVANQHENACLFMQMAASFHGREVYLKPHPRDTSDYSTYFKKRNILKADVPIELLNCLGEGIFETAATWCSTAVNNLWACKHIVVFAPDDSRANAEHRTLSIDCDAYVA